MDTERLRELAERAEEHSPSPWIEDFAGVAYMGGVGWVSDDIDPEVRPFIAAANPQTILELLDENADLSRRVQMLEDQVRSMAEWRIK